MGLNKIYPPPLFMNLGGVKGGRGNWRFNQKGWEGRGTFGLIMRGVDGQGGGPGVSGTFFLKKRTFRIESLFSYPIHTVLYLQLAACTVL